MTPEQEQLLALIAAAEADPSEMGALIDFIEGQTGQQIGSLLQPEWGDVREDGETRTGTLTVLGIPVTITITATFVAAQSCVPIQEYVIPLEGERDVSLPFANVGGTSLSTEWTEFPEFEVHFEHPRMVWLDMSDPTDAAINDNLTRGASSNGIVIGGTTYRSRIQWRMRFTGKIAEKRQYATPAGVRGEMTQHTYSLHNPPIGLREGFRYMVGESPCPEDPQTNCLETSTPPRLGTVTEGGGGLVINQTDYNTMLSTGSLNDPDWRIPTFDSLVGGTQDWDTSGTSNFSTGGPNPVTSAALLQDKIDDYMANRTPGTATIELDWDTMTFEVSRMEHETAFYTNEGACGLLSAGRRVHLLTITYGGYVGSPGMSFPVIEYTTSGLDDGNYLEGLLFRIIREEIPNQGLINSTLDTEIPQEHAAGTYVPSPAAVEAADGQPPDTTPNPPRPIADDPMVPVPMPVSGGCRSTMDGPASCNFNAPLPEPNFEEPEFNPDFPLPGDYPVFPDEFPEMPFPEMPIFDANYPQFPNFCAPPNFGQMTDCKPQPGTNHVPGGRDRQGNQGTGLFSFKTGSELYGVYDDTFNQDYPIDDITGEFPEDPDTGEPVVPPQRCWPENSSIMTAITTILLDLGVSPLNIVWEIGPEWDKTFGPHCFPETTRMFDAAVWLAQKLMLRIIDEGAPSGKVYIGPPTHRPQSQTFTFADTYYPGLSTNPPFANLAHGYSQTEAYYAVKVWGSHLPNPAWAIVDTPFAKDPTVILEVQVGPNYTFDEAQELAFFRAALIRRAAVSVQVTVPFSENYYMRDSMVLQVPSAGYQETFTIFGKQSEVSVESRAHILTGVLPATLAELDQFPELLEEPEPLGAAFLDWPKMRSATKRKGARRLERHLRRRERMGLAVR